MPFRMGPLELVIILAIVLILFGVGRIGKIGGELGKGIKAFRLGIQDNNEDNNEDNWHQNLFYKQYIQSKFTLK